MLHIVINLLIGKELLQLEYKLQATFNFFTNFESYIVDFHKIIIQLTYFKYYL